MTSTLTLATETEVQALLDRMAELNGGAFIDRAVWPHHLVDAGRSLVVALGATPEQARQLTDKELQSFYSVTRKGGAFSGRSLIGKRFKVRPMSHPLPAPPSPIAAPTAPPANPLAPVDLTALYSALDAVEADLDKHKSTTRHDFNVLVDECQLINQALKRLQDNALPPVTIQVADMPAVTFEVAHPSLQRVIRKAANGEDVWLVGDRGSGKSVAARQVAEALGISCHVMTGADDKTDITGYIQPHNGTILRTPFRDAWEHGGVILLDEMDTYNPAALIVINDALANKRCSFPDMAIDKHKQCVIMAATNTDGRGGNAVYSARSVIDASTRDRFAYIPWGYVPAMETMLGALNPAWTEYVQAVRSAMESMSIPEPPSPRASIMGGKGIATGDTWAEAAESYIWKGVAADYQRRINAVVDMASFSTKCPFSISIL